MRRIAPKFMRGLAVKADRSAAAICSASYVRRPRLSAAATACTLTPPILAARKHLRHSRGCQAGVLR